MALTSTILLLSMATIGDVAWSPIRPSVPVTVILALKPADVEPENLQSCIERTVGEANIESGFRLYQVWGDGSVLGLFLANIKEAKCIQLAIPSGHVGSVAVLVAGRSEQQPLLALKLPEDEEAAYLQPVTQTPYSQFELDKDRSYGRLAGTMTPVFRDGALFGYRLSKIPPDSLFQKIGLEDGDVLETIDGTPVTPENVSRLFDLTRHQKRFNIELEREGARTTFYYNLR